MIGVTKGSFAILIAAVASAMSSAVFQIAILVDDGWIRAHLPPYMPYLYVLCALLWVWWGISYFFARRKEPIVSAPAVHAPIHVEVKPVFNNNPTFSPVQTNQQIAEPPSDPEPTRSTLQVLKPVFEQLCPFRGGWHAARPGEVLGAVAWVHNPTAEEGEIGTLIRDARASLAYRKEGHLVFTIETAYWLEESGYEIDLKPGMTRGIVLALFPAGTSSPFWFGSQNHRRDRIAAPRPGRMLVASSPQYVNFVIPEEIEISIVSKQRTVRKVTIIVKRDDRLSYELSLGGNEI
jgi:hypothetical protein